jgi:anti-sigma factor RsiW
MTISGISDPACRGIRLLLGVYVVGAIDPAERAIVDEHLGQCAACRDELASMAGLPAMLSRVPAADLEQLSLAPAGLPEMAEPSDKMLGSLLERVSVRRRSRLWRGAIAVAASAAIAAGGAAAAVELAAPAAPAAQVASAVSPGGHVSAVVDYSPTSWGTAMRVQVTGISSGTTCQFWVVGRDGKPSLAGSWVVAGGYDAKGSSRAWYSASSSMTEGSVKSFRLTSGGRVLLDIPAT